MTPDEVRMLDNRYALLFIRGERPVMDFKYDILKHPSVRLTTDGQSDPYIHGEPWDAGSSIELVSDPKLIADAAANAKLIESRRPVITVNFSDGFDDFYTVEADISLDDLHLQTEEVADARWASRKEIEAMIDDGSFILYQKDLLGYLFFAREGRGTWNL